MCDNGVLKQCDPSLCCEGDFHLGVQSQHGSIHHQSDTPSPHPPPVDMLRWEVSQMVTWKVIVLGYQTYDATGDYLLDEVV